MVVETSMPESKETTGEPGGILLEQVLGKVQLGEPLAWKNVQVFPLSRSNGHAPAYTLIDDLLESGQAEVTEIGESGSVPRIKVLNKSDLDALILDGLELRGAKQNRMVNLTIIAGKHAETEIPVACVEAGRWSRRAGVFASSKSTVAGKMRACKAGLVSEGLRSSGRPTVDQNRVWREVDGYLHEAGAASPTSAFDAAFERHQDEVEKFTKQLEDIEAHGAIVAVNGQIVSLDLFDAMATFKKLWPALVRGHGLDAVLAAEEHQEPADREIVNAWLESIRRDATATQYDVPGVGEHYSVRRKDLASGITVHQDKAVHVALFSVPDDKRLWDEV